MGVTSSYKGAVLAMFEEGFEAVVVVEDEVLVEELLSLDRYSRPARVYFTRSFRLLWRVSGPHVWSSLIMKARKGK